MKRWRSVETLVPADPQDVQKVRQYTEQLVEVGVRVTTLKSRVHDASLLPLHLFLP